MAQVLLVDLIHGCGPTCSADSALPQDPDVQVFLLTGKRHHDITPLDSRANVRVLDSATTAECLYLFKQSLDRMELNCIRILTSPRGRKLLARYQEQLFTALYSFQYTVTSEDGLTCAGSTHTDSPGDRVEAEVLAFLQQLPALRGPITVLRSTLIPDVFGHGFSSRPGGVSYVPTLSSLNLFSSSRRRDPVAVVTENRRRLAVHAGFHPKPLRLVKVNHANDVWVLGRAEPQSYDGMVTNQTGVVLAAPGADCMPVLFADPVSKVIGVAHAGWKGTLMGVAVATVEAMKSEFGCRASDIVVAVGPSVGACCFTLDRRQALDFVSIHPDCVPDPGSARPHVDIRLANRLLLQKGGILPQHIHDHALTERPCVTPCTACHPELYFSHVRDGLHFGTQVGFLWIEDTSETPSIALM